MDECQGEEACGCHYTFREAVIWLIEVVCQLRDLPQDLLGVQAVHSAAFRGACVVRSLQGRSPSSDPSSPRGPVNLHTGTIGPMGLGFQDAPRYSKSPSGLDPPWRPFCSGASPAEPQKSGALRRAPEVQLRKALNLQAPDGGLATARDTVITPIKTLSAHWA